MSILIRILKQGDIEQCIKLFQETVHAINSKDYTPDQLNVWAPHIIDSANEQWQSLLTNIALVAEIENSIVGFIDMTDTGYLDRLYVHKDHQGEGIATLLLNEIERIAKGRLVTEITTEASITAKPFFEAKGYHVINEQQKDVNGTIFINYVMKKKIS